MTRSNCRHLLPLIAVAAVMLAPPAVTCALGDATEPRVREILDLAVRPNGDGTARLSVLGRLAFSDEAIGDVVIESTVRLSINGVLHAQHTFDAVVVLDKAIGPCTAADTGTLCGTAIIGDGPIEPLHCIESYVDGDLTAPVHRCATRVLRFDFVAPLAVGDEVLVEFVASEGGVADFKTCCCCPLEILIWKTMFDQPEGVGWDRGVDVSIAPSPTTLGHYDILPHVWVDLAQGIGGVQDFGFGLAIRVNGATVAEFDSGSRPTQGQVGQLGCMTATGGCGNSGCVQSDLGGWQYGCTPCLCRLTASLGDFGVFGMALLPGDTVEVEVVPGIVGWPSLPGDEANDVAIVVVPAGPADLNGDGVVNGADLGVLLNTWGPCTAPCPADLNGDGVVDGADLGLLLNAWS